MVARSCQIVVAVMLLAGVAHRVHADARGVLRLGVEPLSLEPSADTPILGGFFDDAVTAYNAASAAYNRAHDVMTLAPINRSALGVHATMVTFAPGLEVGGEHAVFRMEALIGLSDTHRAIGIGVYPLDLAWPIDRTFTPYAAAGGTASWLDRTDVDGEIGGLVTLRAAAGVRVGDRVSVEIGYGMYVAGGIVDSAKLHSMAHYDPNGAPPPPADHAVAGGEQSGMIDVSLGVRM